jgi:hypothetical protein
LPNRRQEIDMRLVPEPNDIVGVTTHLTALDVVRLATCAAIENQDVCSFLRDIVEALIDEYHRTTTIEEWDKEFVNAYEQTQRALREPNEHVYRTIYTEDRKGDA